MGLLSDSLRTLLQSDNISQDEFGLRHMVEFRSGGDKQ